MAPLKIPVGISDFKKLREDGYYYIDKSGLIADLLTNNSEVTLITRPRRFGKTLAMSMLANFFDIRRNSQNLFAGLHIEAHQALCRTWMNQFPTLFLTFKDVDGLDYASARDMLRSQIARLYNEHSYLSDSPSVNENDRKEFMQLADIVDGKPTDTMLKTSILLLLRMTISYHDYKEDFYHAFLAGIFAGAGYVVESNREHGEGRSDIIVFDLHGGRMAIFAAKYSKTLEKLNNAGYWHLFIPQIGLSHECAAAPV